MMPRSPPGSKWLLLTNDQTSGLKTDVDTQKGVVTLTGRADSAAQKELTAELAKDVGGVRQVINNIELVG